MLIEQKTIGQAERTKLKEQDWKSKTEISKWKIKWYNKTDRAKPTEQNW